LRSHRRLAAAEPGLGPGLLIGVRVVIAAGGTGGHTSAGLAVAAALVAGGTEVHWIGSHEGVEARRVPEAGVPFYSISTGKLRRYWDRKNVSDLLLRVPAGFGQSWGLLRRLKPAVLFSAGGFVSVPPALAARALGIPIVVHEQTAVPGLANRITARFAARIAVSVPQTSFPQSGRGFPADRVVLTGNPVRGEVLGGSREGALGHFGFDATVPLVYVTGGAQGSHRINRVVGEALPRLLVICQILHQCGDNGETGDFTWLQERARLLPSAARPRYAVRPYVGAELRDVYAAAALLVGRSGAGTVTECCNLGVPAVFIPLPGASGDEQAANARLVERAGGAVVLPQGDLTAESLTDTLTRLLADRAALQAMGARARALAIPDAAQRLARIIREVAAP
jgi:UDP-N-acetylglucosamine--N-acetylmuramyl-(pentapeptide) pyrophosphoryl-undecaprenol N-acetylglucosamine transferase